MEILKSLEVKKINYILKKNLVSIVVNCHNGESFLKETISSILNQTYKNWELILGQFFN